MRASLYGIAALLLAATVFAGQKNRELTNYRDQCELGYHSLSFTVDDCTGSYPVLSCHGRCQSTSTPKFYTKRYQSTGAGDRESYLLVE